MRWLLSLLTYTGGLVAVVAKMASGHPDVFSTITNLPFVLPLLLLAISPSKALLPTVYALCIFQGFGSFIHHMHGCTQPDYRVMDHLFYLLLYAYLMVRSAWVMFCDRACWRISIRATCMVLLILVICLYRTFLAHNVTTMIVFGSIAGACVFVDSQLLRRQQTFRSGFASAAMMIALIGTASLFLNTRSRLRAEEDYKNDVYHGMWHLLASQFQFVLIFSLMTSGQLADEWVELLWCVLLLCVFAGILVSKTHELWIFLLVFLFTNIFMVWRLIVALKIRVQVRDGRRLRLSYAEVEIAPHPCV